MTDKLLPAVFILHPSSFRLHHYYSLSPVKSDSYLDKDTKPRLSN